MKVRRVNGTTEFRSNDGKLHHYLRHIVEDLINDKNVKVTYREDEITIKLATGSVETFINSAEHRVDLIYNSAIDDSEEDLHTLSLDNVKEMVEGIQSKYNEHLQRVKDNDFEEVEFNL
jgi:hypothetical protein